MKTSKIDIDTFEYQVWFWMPQVIMGDYGLNETDMLVYAVIHQIVTDDEDCIYEGPLSFIAEVIGETEENVSKSVDRLIEKKRIRDSKFVKPDKGCRCFDLNGWPLDF